MKLASIVLMDVTMGLIGVFLMLAFYANDNTGKNAQSPSEVAPAAAPELSMVSSIEEISEDTPAESANYQLPALTIDGAGRKIRSIHLDDTRIEMSGIEDQLRRRNIRKLRIRAHPDLAVQVEREIKWLCRQAGVEEFDDVYFKSAQ